jgi:hypothetical protein
VFESGGGRMVFVLNCFLAVAQRLKLTPKVQFKIDISK